MMRGIEVSFHGALPLAQSAGRYAVCCFLAGLLCLPAAGCGGQQSSAAVLPESTPSPLPSPAVAAGLSPTVSPALTVAFVKPGGEVSLSEKAS